MKNFQRWLSWCVARLSILAASGLACSGAPSSNTCQNNGAAGTDGNDPCASSGGASTGGTTNATPPPNSGGASSVDTTGAGGISPAGGQTSGGSTSGTGLNTGGESGTGGLAGTGGSSDRCTGVVCTAIDGCHLAGTCDPSAGECTSPIAPDGILCDDGNACTQLDVCMSGACAGNAPVTCTPIDSCHDAGICGPATGVCGEGPVLSQGSGLACLPAAIPLIRPGAVLTGGTGHITQAEGGLVKWPGVNDLPAGEISFPPNAVSSDTDVTVVAYDGGSDREPGAVIYRLSPDGLQLGSPARLTVGYRQTWVSTGGFDEGSIMLAHISGPPPEHAEMLAPDTLDTNANTASFHISHFTDSIPTYCGESVDICPTVFDKCKLDNEGATFIYDLAGSFWEDNDHLKIVIVHGLGDGCSSFVDINNPDSDVFGNRLTRALKTIYPNVDLACFQYPSGGHVDVNADRLAIQFARFKFSKATFVAHSMGGLLVRYAIQHHSDFRDRVSQLITLGTPHEGTDGTDILPLFTCGKKEPIFDDLARASGDNFIARLSSNLDQEGDIPYFAVWTPDDVAVLGQCTTNSCSAGTDGGCSAQSTCGGRQVVPDDSEQGLNLGSTLYSGTNRFTDSLPVYFTAVRGSAYCRDTVPSDGISCGNWHAHNWLHSPIGDDDPMLVPNKIRDWLCARPEGLSLPGCPKVDVHLIRTHWQDTSKAHLVWNSAYQTWNTASDGYTARGAGQATSDANNIFLLSGQGPGGDAEWSAACDSYDIASNTWSRMPDVEQVRLGASASVVGSRLFLIGGYIGYTNGTITSRTDIYDRDTNSWSNGSVLPVGRYAMATAVTPTGAAGRIHMLAGAVPCGSYAGCGTRYSRHDVYDVSLSQWQRLADVPIAGWQGCAFYSDGKIYLLYLQDDAGNLHNFEYNVTNDSWSDFSGAEPPPPVSGIWSSTGCVSGAGQTIDNELYLWRGDGYVTYSPATRVWTTHPIAGAPASDHYVPFFIKR